MRDCAEDLLGELSEILFNELAFFRLMEDLNSTKSKVKATLQQWCHRVSLCGTTMYVKSNPLLEAPNRFCSFTISYSMLYRFNVVDSRIRRIDSAMFIFDSLRNRRRPVTPAPSLATSSVPTTSSRASNRHPHRTALTNGSRRRASDLAWRREARRRREERR